jgi:chorismate synthase
LVCNARYVVKKKRKIFGKMRGRNDNSVEIGAYLVSETLVRCVLSTYSVMSVLPATIGV